MDARIAELEEEQEAYTAQVCSINLMNKHSVFSPLKYLNITIFLLHIIYQILLILY